jgi:hypothetical protein
MEPLDAGDWKQTLQEDLIGCKVLEEATALEVRLVI